MEPQDQQIRSVFLDLRKAPRDAPEDPPRAREGPEELPRGTSREPVWGPLLVPKCMVFHWFYTKRKPVIARTGSALRRGMNTKHRVTALPSKLALCSLPSPLLPRIARTMIKDIIHASAARSLASLGSAQLAPNGAQKSPREAQERPQRNAKRPQNGSQEKLLKAPQNDPERLQRTPQRDSKRS